MDNLEQMGKENLHWMRWRLTGGKPTCPRCGCETVYQHKNRKTFKCKLCERHFSATTGTMFASSKISADYIVAVISILEDDINTKPCQIAKELGLNYKTSFVLVKKIREALKKDGVTMESIFSAPVSREWKGYWQRGSYDKN